MVKRKTSYDCVIRCRLNDTVSTSGSVIRLMKSTNCTQYKAEEDKQTILGTNCFFLYQSSEL
jgi:hypothetical protein